MTRLLAFVALFTATASAQPKLKVIVDQDACGPCTTDILVDSPVRQSPRAKVLGITIVSGDLWMEQELRHALRALGMTRYRALARSLTALSRESEKRV